MNGEGMKPREIELLCAPNIKKRLVFFFASRRRHTRCGRDWSSDVCSSDLETARLYGPAAYMNLPSPNGMTNDEKEPDPSHLEIGRASCRERVEISEVA